jgi:hypothetical protein
VGGIHREEDSVFSLAEPGKMVKLIPISTNKSKKKTIVNV